MDPPSVKSHVLHINFVPYPHCSTEKVGLHFHFARDSTRFTSTNPHRRQHTSHSSPWPAECE